MNFIKITKPMNQMRNITDSVTIDIEIRTLTHHPADITVSMRPLPFKVLLYLLKHQDRCVSREELFEECWQGVLVTDQSLTNTISYIRKVFKKLDTNELELKTISKQGYLLVISPKQQALKVEEIKPFVDAEVQLELADAGTSIDEEKISPDLQQPVSTQKTKTKFPRQFTLNLCALWLGIILVAYYSIHYNKEQAPFLNKGNYQSYPFGSATLYVHDQSNTITEPEMTSYIKNLELSQCNVKSIYIRITNSAFRDNIISMYAFVFTNNRKSQNIFKQKLDGLNIYPSIITPLLDSFYCKGKPQQ
ncbi:winged helix-turn-helix domain-containing protein [Vibrio sp. 10N.261.52.A1]|uniref:winged helix-turn-helix domain-containing protein n=1 Tax=Vibrio TaxID=662 RepID=UPI000C850764|nr:winged helix-turn-helix domain-containing protein [Vibrio sp. 10N.261.52.A1]PML57685.1 transcriptional regulator [Vibrio sp. 10N.261.52.A1]